MNAAAASLAWVFVFSAAVALDSASAATPIYRCGKEYSQTPCAGGRLLETADTRSAAQQAEARRVAIRERRLAADLAHERRLQEAANPPPAASGFHARPVPVEPAASAAHAQRGHARPKRPRTTTDFVAFEPRKPKAATGK